MFDVDEIEASVIISRDKPPTYHAVEMTRFKAMEEVETNTKR